MEPVPTRSSWFDDDASFAAAVRDALRDDAPVPRVPGCEDLREIGRGGQGIVYSALQTSTRRRVAVKVLLDMPGRTRSARARFDRELEIVASLHDPRLVQIFDGGTTEDGRPFVVMELVLGLRLDLAADVVAARAAGWSRPFADRAIALFAGICEGLDCAHRRGVIHRDLKPSNILVDATGTPRVLDFGLAKAAGLAGEGFATTAGARFVGSLPWTSPEQAEGRIDAIDVRSDVYALGATLYDLVTGRPPCPLDVDFRAALDAVVNESPAPPAKLDPRCDRDLEAVILRALEKDPQRRYPTAGALALDLSHLLAGEPIEARRETAWRGVVKLAGRRRRFAIAAAIVAIAAIGVLALTLSLWRRAETESDRAERALTFFLDAIGAVDPRRDGADARLVDALTHVSAQLDANFGDSDHEVRLRVRTRLRALFMRLGKYDLALVEADHVSKLARARLPVSGSQEFRALWQAERLRAVNLHVLGRREEALALFSEAYEVFARVYGELDNDSLGALAGKAQTLKGLERIDEAEAALRAILEATKESTTFENGAMARATAFDNLSAIAEMRGRPSEAEAPQREAVRVFERAFGHESQEALGARSSLGSLLLTLGRVSEAVDLLVPTVDALRKQSGAKHPMTLGAMHNLGVAFVRAERLDEAERILHETYESRLELGGESAPLTVLTFKELSGIAGKRAEAAARPPVRD